MGSEYQALLFMYVCGFMPLLEGFSGGWDIWGGGLGREIYGGGDIYEGRLGI